MRTVIYVVNGHEYNTKAEMLRNEGATNFDYKVELREEAETRQVSPLRKMMLEQFGYVHPNLLRKITI